MKKFASIVLLSTLFATASAAEPQVGSGETDGYRLVWQDLFDNNELNPLRWNIEVNGDGGGNAELQYYTDSEKNVRVGDDGEGNGCLILTACRESYRNKNFTSGRLNSMNMVTFKHGKIEASIKLPKTANGLWPAFWMMGNDYSQVGWPKCGETDILEMGNAEGIKNGTQERFFNGACHWGAGWPNASYANSSTKNYSLQDGEFHLYTCIWDEKEIRMYVDLDKMPLQTPYYKIDISEVDPSNEWVAGNYFHKDNFIIFDLAVGGNFTGIHNPADITALNDANGQQASMYINYVKIYQKGVASEDLYSAVPSDPLTSESLIAPVLAEDSAEFDGKVVSFKTTDDVTVFNLDGLPVVRAEAVDHIDIDSLPAGVYFVRHGLTVSKIIKK